MSAVRINGIAVEDWRRAIAWVVVRARLRTRGYRDVRSLGPSLRLRFSASEGTYAVCGKGLGFADALILIPEEVAERFALRLTALREGTDDDGAVVLDPVTVTADAHSPTYRLTGPTMVACTGGIHLTFSEADRLIVALGRHRLARWGRGGVRAVDPAT